MTELKTKTYIGNDTYSVAECLKNMRGAFGELEAVKWGFCIQTAFLINGYNEDIDKSMKEILASKGVPPIVAKAEISIDGELCIPQTLVNYIFKPDFDQEQLKQLWLWIKENFIDEIIYPYQYLSLLIFLENHHTFLLKQPTISNTEMQTQMDAWYYMSEVKCCSDALGTYRNGFINSDKFRYVSWINSDGTPPLSYEYKRDQSMPGFQALNRLCNDLETNISELKI